MATSNEHKQGASFTRLLIIPAEFANGYFTEWTVASQVRTTDDQLLSDCVCTWLDPLTTRNLKIRVADTSAWPAEQDVHIDVKFSRAADGEVMPTTTAVIHVTKKVTA